MTTVERLALPDEDDCCISSIEVHFAVPVYLPMAAQRELHEFISALVKLKRNQLVGCVHWLSGYGSKPNWSQADQRFLGQSVDPNAPARGEPTFDDSVMHFETCCRPAWPSEMAP
jgi:hypothetical protein